MEKSQKLAGERSTPIGSQYMALKPANRKGKRIDTYLFLGMIRVVYSTGFWKNEDVVGTLRIANYLSLL